LLRRLKKIVYAAALRCAKPRRAAPQAEPVAERRPPARAAPVVHKQSPPRTCARGQKGRLLARPPIRALP